jgi:hypothetical protein
VKSSFVTRLLLLIILLCARFVGAQDYPCQRISGPIVVDGKLEEAAWKDAEPLEFIMPITHRAPHSRTVGRMCWDSEHLYVAFAADDEDVTSSLTGRDAYVYLDDALETFVQPPSPGGDYCNFEINALGTVFDAIRGINEKKWNCSGLQVGIQIDGTLNNSADHDRGWTMEVAIPFASLPPMDGEQAREGDTWRFLLARYDYAVYTEKSPELSACAPALTAQVPQCPRVADAAVHRTQPQQRPAAFGFSALTARLVT